MMNDELKTEIETSVANALREDVGAGDLTAALVDADAVSGATVVARETMTIAGMDWFNEVFRQLDESIIVDWYVTDGQQAEPDDVVCKLVGNSRAMLTGERTALNFLQTLSGTATTTAQFVAAVNGTQAKILDTRKTIPGLRLAQKYAVRCGGGRNHRVGLYDGILIKENHIKSAGGIANALAAVEGDDPDVMVEIEVESLDELKAALDAGATRILLDNFSLGDTREAVALNSDYGFVAAELEVSGNVDIDSVRELAETGVNYISIGALTKHVRAADLSMRFSIGS
ncbi:MAG: carboxylating nicotinate-nucleotide diphosphorylase [Woeseiaceae bacterium]|nr:carboxylating nicotinate-nucleotide diphosphorylase [Woeseiaceae bacterium]